MAEAKAKVVLDLDNKEFIQKLRESMGLVGSLGNAQGFEDITKNFLAIGRAVGVATAAFAAAKTAFDLTLQAEKIEQISRSFDAMAESVGLAARTIREDLIEATGGLIDDDEALQSATRAMAALGDQAARIPEIMSLARKATVLFGGEVTQNFETFSTAIASGNARSLRQFGIIVDTEKALEKYARTLGVSANYLSEAGKKQAVANAALEQARAKFQNVDESALKATNSFKRFQVQLGELVDTTATAVGQSSAFGKFFDYLSKSAQGYGVLVQRYLGTGLETERLKMSELSAGLFDARERLKALNAEYEKASMLERPFMQSSINRQRDKVKELEREVELQRTKVAGMEKEAEAQAKAEAKPKAEAPAAKAGGVDLSQLRKDQEAFLRDVAKLESEIFERRKANALDMATYEAAHAEQVRALAEQAAMQAQEVDQKAASLGLQNDEQVANAKAAIYENLNLKLNELEMQRQNAAVQVAENQLRVAQTTAEGIAAAFALGSAQAARDFENFGRRGQVVFKAFEKNAVSSLIALGEGTADAGEAMRGFMFGALADIAEAEGRVMLLQAFHNPAAGAAGAALLVLSGVLRGMAGSRARGDIGGGGAGGGAQGGVTAPGEARPEAEQAPRRAVTIQIQGSYFETDQTRARLMEMIRESGDFTDFNLRQIGG